MEKPIRWMGQTKTDLRGMSEDVKDEIGHSLDIAQRGGRARNAGQMKGNLRSVMEIRVDEDSNTYRAMYTTELEGVIYVLHVFKKKAKKRRSTPKRDLDRIEQSLKAARKHFQRFGPPQS